MMRILISLSLVLFFSSCTCPCKKENFSKSRIKVLKTDDGTIREFVLNTGPNDTDHRFSYDFALPRGFYFDTLVFSDSSKHVSFLAYPIVSDSSEFKIYTGLLRKFLYKEFLHHASFMDGTELKINPYFSYDLEVGPHQLFINEKVISMCFMVDSYSTGGNHHNYQFLTFNYDREKKRQIYFGEVFPMKTKKDTLELINHLNWQIAYDNLPQTYDSLDFAFTKNGVCFHTWWHMKQALLDMDSISAYKVHNYYHP